MTRAQGTRERIRDTAIRLIAAKGFEQTSLREVAEEVGITKASLYYHFASKQALLFAIVDPVVARLRAVSTELDDVARGDDGIRRVLAHYLDGLIEHREVGALFVRDSVAIVNAIADSYPELHETNSRMQAWLAGPDPSVEAQLRAAAALAVLGSALTSSELVPDAKDDDVERVLLECAMGLLRR